VARLADLSELLDLAHDAILVRDPDSRIVYVNREAVQLYGRSRGELLGQVTHDLFRTRFPVSREAIDAALATSGWWEGRLLHRRADGTIRMIDSRQVLRSDEQATAAVAADADVADRIAEAIARLDHMIAEVRRHVIALDPNHIGPSDRPEQ
jgi:PAS domain S-box-containing protein